VPVVPSVPKANWPRAEHPDAKEFTIKALGDFTELLIGLRPGRRVYLDGPHGQFTIDGVRSSGFVFIAGGVGITPMMSILRTLADRGDWAHHERGRRNRGIPARRIRTEQFAVV
jgi:ferredoxin-NADP reductase